MVKLGTILRLYKKKKKAISNHSLSHTHPAKKILHCTKILKKTSSLQTIFTYATQNSPSNNISYYKSTVPKSILHEKDPTKLKVYLLSVFFSLLPSYHWLTFSSAVRYWILLSTSNQKLVNLVMWFHKPTVLSLN